MRIYLAGPEVFLPNAREMLDKKIDLTRQYGFVPVSPGDIEIPSSQASEADDKVQNLTIPPHLKGREKGLFISEVNEKLMLSADMIIANLTPYRGVSADVGTVYELGFMCGRGLPSYAFTNVVAGHFERVRDYYHGDIREDENGRRHGPDGLMVENYDLADNLMLDGGVALHQGRLVRHQARLEELYTDLTGFEQCLALAAKDLLN